MDQKNKIACVAKHFFIFGHTELTFVGKICLSNGKVTNCFKNCANTKMCLDQLEFKTNCESQKDCLVFILYLYYRIKSDSD